MSLQLLVGLGNPEPKYDRTRHNIGFAVVDRLASLWGGTWKEQRKFQGLFTEVQGSHKESIKLLKPLTYMNLSGQSIRAVTDWYKFPPASVLVIYDDMDLPLGKIRLRLSGSAGGHNGMKSTIAHLGTDQFPRLRIGIGKADGNKETVSHVLGKFAPEETKLLEGVLQMVTESVEISLKDDLAKAMNIYNNKIVTQ